MRRLRYLQALNEALHQELGSDASVILMGEDIRENMRGETRGLYAKYGGERVLDVPISEAGFTGLATGAAMAGLRPVVEFQIPSLVFIAFDQLANQAAKLPLMTGGQARLPVTYLIMGAGAHGNMAGQHSDTPSAFLVHAGIKTVVPASPHDVKGLTVAAIREDDPVAVVVPVKLLGVRGDVPEESYVVPLGVGRTVREGRDVTVVATGHLVSEAAALADELEREGISVHIWDPRSLLPFDLVGFEGAVSATGRLVVCDDTARSCGIGAHLASLAAERCFDQLRSPVRVVTRGDVPISFSPALESVPLPTREKIKAAVMSSVLAEGSTPHHEHP